MFICISVCIYTSLYATYPLTFSETCTKFLQDYATEFGLEFSVYNVSLSIFIISFIRLFQPERPMVILTLPGTDKSLKSLLLYSHTDVVPTFKVKEFRYINFRFIN